MFAVSSDRALVEISAFWNACRTANEAESAPPEPEARKRSLPRGSPEGDGGARLAKARRAKAGRIE
jgi:hypothetical protein